ncbi:unnamed protein product [Lactuca virosa]|uniref:Transposase (putative) gypsy type domain-containing protein n=1 Tax=Lactuca virosa TaxID=75947 RepID=A0AAU9NK88_9ASTR|nr:unnamed protein product [Lactuca virosa]
MYLFDESDYLFIAKEEKVTSSSRIDPVMPSYRIYGIMLEGTTSCTLYAVTQLSYGCARIRQPHILVQTVFSWFRCTIATVSTSLCTFSLVFLFLSSLRASSVYRWATSRHIGQLHAFDFLETVLDYYGLHIAQINPNGFLKILCFTLLCVALGVSPTINLSRHFYIPISNGDWGSLSLRHGLVEICDGLPTSIKCWKEELFFVHASAFSGPMAYGATSDRAADPVPKLSSYEQLISERLSDNFVRWVDPDEVMLGMAGMSPHWKHLVKKLVEMLEGKDVTLLDRLHRRRIANSALVTDEVIVPNSPNRSESSMDFALDISRAEGSRPIPPTLRSKR